MKKIITKKIWIVLGLILLFANISAQNDAQKKSECDSYLTPSKFIFQGKVISSKLRIRRKVSEHKYLNFDSYLIQVQKVIKGDMQKGTVQIITGTYGIGFEDTGKISEYVSTDGSRYDNIPPSEGIFFSNEGIVDVKDSSAANTNSKSLQFWCAIPLLNGELVKEKRGISQYFSTLSDFYAYISANYGIKIDAQ
jgi:hypothetical protein